jgi:hypothetical protein
MPRPDDILATAFLDMAPRAVVQCLIGPRSSPRIQDALTPCHSLVEAQHARVEITHFPAVVPWSCHADWVLIFPQF